LAVPVGIKSKGQAVVLGDMLALVGKAVITTRTDMLERLAVAGAVVEAAVILLQIFRLIRAILSLGMSSAAAQVAAEELDCLELGLPEVVAH
jgi:hypothetical protein